jgi:hypothetical protein
VDDSFVAPIFVAHTTTVRHLKPVHVFVGVTFFGNAAPLTSEQVGLQPYCKSQDTFHTQIFARKTKQQSGTLLSIDVRQSWHPPHNRHSLCCTKSEIHNSVSTLSSQTPRPIVGLVGVACYRAYEWPPGGG